MREDLPPGDVLLDASVLINFLAVDRVDLLHEQPGLRFLVTGHVDAEVTVRNPRRIARYQSALSAGHLHPTVVDTIEELSVFADLSRALGEGESAAIAAAGVRGLPLAIDDRAAAKRARSVFPALRVVGTRELMVRAIRCGLLSVEEADAIKAEWEARHRFRIPCETFRELL